MKPRILILPDKRYTPIPSDEAKVATEAGAEIHTAHIMGDRKNQEDRDVHFECDYFRLLSPANRKKAMLMACDRMDRECLDVLSHAYNSEQDGACANFTISWIENIPGTTQKKLVTCTANSGDVSSFYAIEDKGKVKNVIRLNPSLHSAEDVRNNPRYKTFNDRGVWRLGDERYGGLMMYRCFGNPTYRQYGHSGESDYSETSVLLNSEEKAHIIVACDGLTEIIPNFLDLAPNHKDRVGAAAILESEDKKPYSEKFSMELFVLSIFQEALSLQSQAESSSNKNLAWHLVNLAYCGSTDNISAKVMLADGIARCGGILDGHSGILCAEYASRNFEEALLDASYELVMAEVLNKESKAEAKLVPSIFDLIHKITSIIPVGNQGEELILLQQKLKKYFLESAPYTTDKINRLEKIVCTLLKAQWRSAALRRRGDNLHQQQKRLIEVLDKAPNAILNSIIYDHNAIIIAAELGDLAKIQTFMTDKTNDINKRYGTFEHTALMVAVKNGQTAVASLLLKFGADETLRNAEGNSALDLARKLPANTPEQQEKKQKMVDVLTTQLQEFRKIKEKYAVTNRWKLFPSSTSHALSGDEIMHLKKRKATKSSDRYRVEPTIDIPGSIPSIRT